MKATILALICCGAFAACATPRATSEHAQRANTPAAVAQRREELAREIAQLEREQTNPELRRSVHKVRIAWSEYLNARREGDAAFARLGITFGSDYYRLQHRLLDAQAAQIRSLRRITQRPAHATAPSA